MKPTNTPSDSSSALSHVVSCIQRNTTRSLLLRLGVVLSLTALFISAFYSGSSAANSGEATKNNAAATVKSANVSSANMPGPLTPRHSFLPFVEPLPQSGGESLATYASDCTTAKSTFVVGETVCVVAAGIPVNPFFPRRLTWATTDLTVVRSTDITTDPQIDSLMITATSLVAGQTIDNRGTWTLVVRNPFFFFPEAIARFTVTDPAHASADLGVSSTFSAASVQTGSQTSFGLRVNNYGPDASTNVSLTDAVPAGTSLVSFAQLTGPTFTCNTANGLTTCTIATLNADDEATFLATYQVNSGTEVTNTAIVSAATQDLYGLNNTISSTTEVEAGAGSGCTLTCPGPIVADNDTGSSGHSIPAANFPTATASGSNCGSVTLSVSPNPQTNAYFFPIGTSFVTAETDSGDTCTFTVTINDVENPTITCPADITTFESSPGSGSKAVTFTPAVADNSGLATVNCDHPSGSNFSLGDTTVKCTATDAAGNTSDECSFKVTVNAINSTCVLTTQAPIVVNSDANACGTHVTFTTPTSDGSGSCGTVTCDHASGSFFGEGQTVVTCTSNPDGASTSFTVTVNDATAPVPNLSSLPTITKDCTANAGVPTTIQTPNGPKVVFEPPTATDNCGGQIQGSTNDPRVYTNPGTFVVHWTYTDASGNESSQDQTINVTGTDTTAPVPDLATLPTVTSECQATVTTVPTATDDCDGTLTGTTSDALTYTGAGTYTVHWTYTDQAGHAVNQNQTVVVTDVHAPTISLVGDPIVTVECHTSFSDPGVTTTDNCVPKNVTVNTTGTVDVNVPNTYTVTYTATDGGGNQASVQRTVIVQDTLKPTINLTGSPTMTVECHTSFTDPGATATDTCDSNVPVNVSGSVNINVPGTYTLTYNASDDSGNAATSVQRVVTVVDTTPPVLNCPSNITVYLPLNTTATSMVVNYTAPVGTDSCGTVNTVQTGGLASGALFPVGTTTNTFRATDASGNFTDCSFTVTVLYDFTGFFQPVDNPPTVNSMKAGQAVPVKFSLSGNKGLNIFVVGSPSSTQVSCQTGDPVAAVEETVTAGNSSLSYNATSDQYIYVWKTDSAWKNTCRTLSVTLNDGTVHTAKFTFK